MFSRIFTLLLFLSSLSCFSQTLEWYDVHTPSDVINSTYFHGPMAVTDDGVWVASIKENQDIISTIEYGKLMLRKFDLDGILLSEIILPGQGHVADIKAVENDLYMHIIVKDSIQLGSEWVTTENGFSKDIFVKRDSEGAYSYVEPSTNNLAGVGITSSGEFLYVNQNGFANSVELKVISLDGQVLMTKDLPGMGYVTGIEEKSDGTGYILLGSCAQATTIDGLEIVPPAFYNNYIISTDTELNFEWFKIIDDISCVRSFGWSGEGVTYWFGGTAIAPTFEDHPFTGPNEIGLDYFLTKVQDEAYNWVNEVVDSTGWSGAFPSEQQPMGVDSEMNTYIIGYARGNAITWENGDVTENEGTRDIFVASYAPSGDLRWARTFGSMNFDAGASIAVVGVDEFVITATISGEMTIDGEVINGEPGVLLTAKFNTQALSAGDVSERRSIQLYPNPTAGLLNLKSIGESEVHQASLISVDGDEIKSWSGSMPEQIDLSELPAGLYFLKLQDARGVTVERIIKR